MGTSITAPAKAKIGAPTSYHEEYCEQIIQFFESKRTARRIKTALEQSDKDGWKRSYKVICGEMPSLTRFAEVLKVSRHTLNDWRKRHENFDTACTRAQDMAAEILAERAHNGLYNAQFAMFYAKNVFHWKDRTEVETVTSPDTELAGQMRSTLASATPDQLQQFKQLIESMQSPAIASTEP